MIENFESEFLAFCRSKPADEAYDWERPSACAQGQFLRSRGCKPGATSYYNGVEYIRYPTVCYQAAVHAHMDKFTNKAYTFGALVKRLEEAGVK